MWPVTQFTRRLGAALALALAVPFCFVGSPARSFAYNECDGVRLVWRRPAVLEINTNSFPFNSAFEIAFRRAMGRWTDVGGSHFDWSYDYTNGAVEPGNGRSEVYAYDLRELDHGNAVAIRRPTTIAQMGSPKPTSFLIPKTASPRATSITEIPATKKHQRSQSLLLRAGGAARARACGRS